MHELRRISLVAALLAAPLAGGTGCLAAAAAGAGAGWYFTSRGAEALVNGSLEEVATRSQGVMAELGITASGMGDMESSTKRELKGKRDDMDITIRLEAQGENQTKVEVVAQRNLAEYDKEYAREVVSKIVAKR